MAGAMAADDRLCHALALEATRRLQNTDTHGDPAHDTFTAPRAHARDMAHAYTPQTLTPWTGNTDGTTPPIPKDANHDGTTPPMTDVAHHAGTRTDPERADDDDGSEDALRRRHEGRDAGSRAAEADRAAPAKSAIDRADIPCSETAGARTTAPQSQREMHLHM